MQHVLLEGVEGDNQGAFQEHDELFALMMKRAARPGAWLHREEVEFHHVFAKIELIHQHAVSGVIPLAICTPDETPTCRASYLHQLNDADTVGRCQLLQCGHGWVRDSAFDATNERRRNPGHRGNLAQTQPA